MLDKRFSDLMGLPSDHIDEENYTSMIALWPQISKLFKTLQPKNVVEIGSQRGFVTQKLSLLCDENTKFTVVDPFLAEDVKNNPRLIPYSGYSLDWLKTCSSENLPDFVILDGDHNYYTVLEECKALDKKNGPQFILFHDTGFPCARRDMYYNPKTIPEPHRHEYCWDPIFSLENMDHWGSRPLPPSIAFAKHYGGPENGVLTAVEDFIKNSPSEWTWVSTPIFCGFGFLWKNLDSSTHQTIKEILHPLQELAPLLGIIEANRFRLLQGIDQRNADIYTLSQRAEDLNRKLQKIRALPGIKQALALYHKLPHCLKSKI